MTTSSFTWPGGKRAAVSITFDDARWSQPEYGLPILDSHNIKATFYVSFPAVEKRLDDWRRIIGNGHEIGNHTRYHPCSGNFPWSRYRALENYTLEQMEQDILEANTLIVTTLGVTPLTFAYPCGQQFIGRGEQVRSYVPIVARHFLAGRAFRNEAPNDPAYCDLAQVNSLTADDLPFDDFKAAIDQALAEGHWLIFTGHEVGDSGRQTVRAEALEALCRYVQSQESDLWVDTVAAVAAYLQQTRR